MPKPPDKNLLPTLLKQNPSPFERDSQDRRRRVRDQVDRVLAVFMQVLPSNYVSQVTGPFYTLQFQAVAEQIAEFQVTAQESFADSFHDFTRPEVLFHILGSLVFPDAQTYGYPEIEGDLTYRTFLQRMVKLLLRGSTKDVMQDGIELLTQATVDVIECGIEARKLKGKSAWGTLDMFTFEVNMSRDGRTVEIDNVPVVLNEFPLDPFILQRNVQIVLRALKPAHVLYDYRHLFRDAFGRLFQDTFSFDYQTYYYQDYRRYWLGAERIAGTHGTTLTDRSLFSDPYLDFSSILPGAWLTILTGMNSIHAGGQEGTSASHDSQYVGRYRVEDIRVFPVGDDPTPRGYTTVSGLSGTVTVVGDAVEDGTQNWALAPEGDILTILEGPNAGAYRLKNLLGLNGGPVGAAVGPATMVQLAPSILRLQRRMGHAVSGQAYEVTVDRLGVQKPRVVDGEDATQFFVR